MGFSGLWKILESIIVRPPTLIDVIEGVRYPLLLQHSIPLFTQEERLATTAGWERRARAWLNVWHEKKLSKIIFLILPVYV